MKKIIIVMLACLPLIGYAQSNTTLTPEQQLEKAQKELEAAQKAVEAAKANAAQAQRAAQEAKQKAEAKAAAEAKAQAEAKAKAIAEKQAAIQAQIKKAQEEAARLNAEAERLKAQADKINSGTDAPAAADAAPAQPEKAPKQDKAVTVTPADEAGWTVPARETTTTKPAKTATKAVTRKAESTTGYLAGAVPVVDGKVVFTFDEDVPGKSASEIYDITYNYMKELTQDEHQKTNELAHSNIALVNENDRTIVGIYKEWLVFNSSFISLDRTEFNYTLIAKCSDGHLNMMLTRINYLYEEGRESEFRTSAEEWITDKYGLNKKQNKLSKMSGKFRRSTIDRKNRIFQGLSSALNQH